MSEKTYDANRHRKSYPFMRKRPVILNTGSAQGEIDIETAKLVFSDEYTKTYNFDGSVVYNKIPVVGASVEDENVLIYITNLSTSSVTIESSSSFTGIVHLQIFKDES